MSGRALRAPGCVPGKRWTAAKTAGRQVRSFRPASVTPKVLLSRSLLASASDVAEAPKLGGAVQRNRAIRGAIAFRRSDRPDVPGADDPPGDQGAVPPVGTGAMPSPRSRSRAWRRPHRGSGRGGSTHVRATNCLLGSPDPALSKRPRCCSPTDRRRGARAGAAPASERPRHSRPRHRRLLQASAEQQSRQRDWFRRNPAAPGRSRASAFTIWVLSARTTPMATKHWRALTGMAATADGAQRCVGMSGPCAVRSEPWLRREQDRHSWAFAPGSSARCPATRPRSCVWSPNGRALRRRCRSRDGRDD
jgi:hypothetical protein